MSLHLPQPSTHPSRVKDQESLVDRLQSEGADVSREIERLLLMRRALEEMTLYLPRLLPSDDPAPPRSAKVEQMLSWWQKDRQNESNRDAVKSVIADCGSLSAPAALLHAWLVGPWGNGDFLSFGLPCVQPFP
jgi:hypothetical protein